jgi:FkbM family methyltransferase
LRTASHKASGTDPSGIRSLRGVRLLRTVHRIVPLGRKYHPLISLFNPREGLVAIPFEGYELVHPAAWRKYVAAFLLAGLHVVPEFRLVPPLCRPLKEGCLVDVGANLGVYTLLLRASSPLPIIAYEPQPFLFRLLQQNIEHNRLSEIEARNRACGSQRGEIPFALGINGGVFHPSAEANASGPPAPPTVANCPHGPEIELDQEAEMMRLGHAVINVPVVPLDEDLAGTPVALMKIDCEGYELKILQGARQLVEQQRPLLFVELHPAELEEFGGSAAAVVEFLERYYTLECWDFSQHRFRSRLVRSLLKHRPNPGHRFPDTTTMLTASAQEPRPTQLYIVAKPKR